MGSGKRASLTASRLGVPCSLLFRRRWWVSSSYVLGTICLNQKTTTVGGSVGQGDYVLPDQSGCLSLSIFLVVGFVSDRSRPQFNERTVPRDAFRSKRLH